jgi:hypothetical protein
MTVLRTPEQEYPRAGQRDTEPRAEIAAGARLNLPQAVVKASIGKGFRHF